MRRAASCASMRLLLREARFITPDGRPTPTSRKGSTPTGSIMPRPAMTQPVAIMGTSMKAGLMRALSTAMGRPGPRIHS